MMMIFHRHHWYVVGYEGLVGTQTVIGFACSCGKRLARRTDGSKSFAKILYPEDEEIRL